MKEANHHVDFHHIDEDAFSEFGRVLLNIEIDELVQYMDTTEIPEDGNVYVASVEEMEQTHIEKRFRETVYGGLPIQIGYCNGVNSTLNGLEYHKGNEINIAITDFVLLLGKVQDINGNSYESSKVKAFYVPKGAVIELYSTTLHFAPCKVEDEGFKAIVVLPKGTNLPLSKEVSQLTEEDSLLFMTNKWLLAHPKRQVLIEKGAYPGIKGENIQIYY
ncbi:DUF4867 domain-containing protein [Bacillus weihaiensis]|uniref:DUF4867 domain-containing protein n=1 Tax=Bacillus weihaiensis TaxID=1547283 RepID=A0A1L3MX36_9BACI|nr:DUF4867 domain-containing protein [Bacillus weihaiensis]